MSDLPGDITKQILSAPPRISRSTRYSETAQGRSTPSSVLLPTGRSSLENARGWIRLPRPAAGMTPHISSLRCSNKAALQRRFFQELNQFGGASAGAVFFQRPLARPSRHRHQLAVVQFKRANDIGGVLSKGDFLIRPEERFQ